jgi:hypothetical protein
LCSFSDTSLKYPWWKYSWGYCKEDDESLGNNCLWSLYSLKEKKEKEALQKTAIHRVVVSK